MTPKKNETVLATYVFHAWQSNDRLFSSALLWIRRSTKLINFDSCDSRLWHGDPRFDSGFSPRRSQSLDLACMGALQQAHIDITGRQPIFLRTNHLRFKSNRFKSSCDIQTDPMRGWRLRTTLLLLHDLPPTRIPSSVRGSTICTADILRSIVHSN